MENFAYEPFAVFAPRGAAGGAGWRGDERAEANRGNGKRSPLPLLPRYAAAARGVCGGIGGAHLFGVNFESAGRRGRRYANYSRFEGHYGQAGSGAEIPGAV